MKKTATGRFNPIPYGIALFATTMFFLKSDACGISGDTIFVKGTRIAAAIGNAGETAEILTPQPGAAPHINGPKIYGCRPGNPFLYRIPATGNRPMLFSASGLPGGLTLDKSSGIITGAIPAAGTFRVTLHASNGKGKDVRVFNIVCGNHLALTPPMGWNDWYSFYGKVTATTIRSAADALISTGVADAGYQYVNIDDCWMNRKDGGDAGRIGPARDSLGNILPNSYFANMKELTAYIHAKGLKSGIYTSPGPTTCAGYTGSYGYEAKDARQFADWGFDFLKYDYCSYENLEDELKQTTPGVTPLFLMQRPYLNMGDIIKAQHRDIVLNLCQYGRENVWTWGAGAGECWRTGPDLGFDPKSMFDVAIQNASQAKWVGPSAWNDPDYLVIGYVGNADGAGVPELTHLKPSEQYAIMSLWSLLAAPLVYSGDLTHLNAFTKNILCNNEVIDIDQDALGKSAVVVKQSGNTFVLAKDLEDGSKAIGLCNKGDSTVTVAAGWSETGIPAGGHIVRDPWRQKNIGLFRDGYSVPVPARSVVLIRVLNGKGR